MRRRVVVALVCAAAIAAALMVWFAWPRGVERPAGFPARQVKDGFVYHFAGTRAWGDAVDSELNAKRVYVFASDQGSDGCGPARLVARVTRQGPTSVRVLVGVYDPPNPRACDGVSTGDVKMTIDLDQPLGSRRLLDGAAHDTARDVLHAASVPTIRSLPARYVETSVGGPGTTPQHVSREWTDRWVNTLSLTVDTTGSTDEPHPTVRQRAVVQGHPATVGWTSGFEQDIVVSWQAGGRTYVIYQTGSNSKQHPPLSVAQLIVLANQVS